MIDFGVPRSRLSVLSESIVHDVAALTIPSCQVIRVTLWTLSFCGQRNKATLLAHFATLLCSRVKAIYTFQRAAKRDQKLKGGETLLFDWQTFLFLKTATTPVTYWSLIPCSTLPCPPNPPKSRPVMMLMWMGLRPNSAAPRSQHPPFRMASSTLFMSSRRKRTS